METICCQSSIRNFHAASIMRFTTLSCKTQKYYACSCSSEETWRSHSTAICRVWVAKHNRIATHYCVTRRLDATFPMHKASQHMQNNSTASAKKRKKSPGTFSSSARTNGQESTAKRRPKPSRVRANFSPQRKVRLPEKTQCSVQILNIQIASVMQQFQGDLPRRVTSKTQSESQDSTAKQLPFEQPWHNHSTVICRNWVATLL